MKSILYSFFVFVSFAFINIDSAKAVETVPYVDVEQYLGRWYQIARNPLWFEPRDCECAQQTLFPLEGETDVIGVYNSCNRGGPKGELRDISGTATNDEPGRNAKFTVDFNQPFKGTYWIIGLDPEYRWAVVTDEGKRSLYILSKTPYLENDLYDAALTSAESQVSIKKLKSTSHKGCSYPELF